MRRVLKEGGFDEKTEPLRVADDAARLRRLARLFRDVNCFAPPDASGLAPVGEYNLRLGVEKEVRPTYVATACSPVAAHEGHAFVVEAAVSVGGLREEEEGLRVYRFANRIPLLFEGGADVATIVAKKRVRWAAYKIDVKKERVGVFVSLVSTKIPFKGTSHVPARRPRNPRRDPGVPHGLWVAAQGAAGEARPPSEGPGPAQEPAGGTCPTSRRRSAASCRRTRTR